MSRTAKSKPAREDEKREAGPLDLDALVNEIGERGSLFVLEGLPFDHPLAVNGYAVLLCDGPEPRILFFQSYGGYLSRSRPERTLDLQDARPARGTTQEVIGRLLKRGYAEYARKAPAPEKKRRGRPRKVAGA